PDDSRLTLFITHSGMGSVNEGLRAGIRMIAIPIKGDQFRNARLLERTGGALIYDKFELSNTSKFEKVVLDALNSEDLRQSAARNALMLQNRPFSMKNIFVRNMEFMGRFGPLRMLDHHGRTLNTFQYYNLDLFLYPALLSTILLVLLYFLIV
ncbi:hypothetical protein PMAYCL1PPCAC_29756, partial [Pristionchus mayeri]